MVARSKKFKRPSSPSSMSEAGRAVVEEAQNQLDAWIDENLDRLESEWTESFEHQRKAISEEILAIEKEMQAARGSVEKGYIAHGAWLVYKALKVQDEVDEMNELWGN